MGILEDSLLSSMEILAKKEVQQAPGTIMIEATIVKNEETQKKVDESQGEYTIKYLDNFFNVFAANKDIKYNNGDMVYVMVPDGDFSKNKIIISSSTPSAISYSRTDTENFLSVSNNLFTTISEPIKMYTFFNYIEGCPKIIDYGVNNELKEGQDSLSSIKDLDVFGQKDDPNNFNNAFSQYLKDYKTFRLSVKIRTEIIPSQRVRGNYGLILSLPVKYKQSNGDYVNTVKKYVLDIDNMLGSPYKLTEWTTQNMFITFKDEEIYAPSNEEDGQPKLSIFIKNFDQKEYELNKETGEVAIENPIYDIFIKDFTFEVYNTLTEAQQKGYFLHLTASDGNFFFGNKKITEDDVDDMPTKTLTPALKYDGKPVILSNKDKEKYECYWFVEDATITTNSTYYVSFGGTGWRCLNTPEKFASTDTGEKTFQYVTNNYTHTVYRTDVLGSIRYKCVIAIIKENNNSLNYVAAAESVIRLDELVDPISIELVNNSDTRTYAEKGSRVEITCSIKGHYTKKGQIIFYWTRKDDMGRYIDNDFYREDETTDTFEKISFMSEKVINGFNTISCTVYDSYRDANNEEIQQILGTTTIAIKTKDISTSVVLQNSNVLYKYDGDGDAPTSPKYNGQMGSRMIIKPIQLTIYNEETGLELSEDEYKQCKVIWTAPGAQHSLVVPLMGKDDETLKAEEKEKEVIAIEDSNTNDAEEEEEKTEKKRENSFEVNEERDKHIFTLTGCLKEDYYFYYKIVEQYNYHKSNNTVSVEVIYNNKTIVRSTDLVFIKEGDNGTNNSNYTAVITHQGNAYGEIISQQEDSITEQKLKLVYIQGEYEKIEIGKDSEGNPIYKTIDLYEPKLDKKNNPIYKKGKLQYVKGPDGKPKVYKQVEVVKVRNFVNKKHWYYHNLLDNKLYETVWAEKDAPNLEDIPNNYNQVQIVEDLPILELKVYHQGQEILQQSDLNVEIEWSVFDPKSTNSTILLKSLSAHDDEENNETNSLSKWKETVTGMSCQVAPLQLITHDDGTEERIVPLWGDENLQPDSSEQIRFNPVNIVQAKVIIRNESKANTMQLQNTNNDDSTLTSNYTELYAYYPIDIVMADTIDIITKKEDSTAAAKNGQNEREYTIPNVTGGFSFVTYNSDGKNPGYDSMSNFECTESITNEENKYNNYTWVSSDNILLEGVEVIESTEEGDSEETVISVNHSQIKGVPLSTYNSTIIQNFIRAELDNLAESKNMLDDLYEQKFKKDRDIRFITDFTQMLLRKVNNKYEGLMIDLFNNNNFPLSNSKTFLVFRKNLCDNIENLQTIYNKMDEADQAEIKNNNYDKLLFAILDDSFVYIDKDKKEQKGKIFIPQYDSQSKVTKYLINDNFIKMIDEYKLPDSYTTKATKKKKEANTRITNYGKKIDNILKNIQKFNDMDGSDNKKTYNEQESYKEFRELDNHYATLVAKFKDTLCDLINLAYSDEYSKLNEKVFLGKPTVLIPKVDSDADLYNFYSQMYAAINQILYPQNIFEIQDNDIIILKGRTQDDLQNFYNAYKDTFSEVKDFSEFLKIYNKAQNEFICFNLFKDYEQELYDNIIKVYYNDLYKPLEEIKKAFNRGKDVRSMNYTYYENNIIKAARKKSNIFYNSQDKKLKAKITTPCNDFKKATQNESNRLQVEIDKKQALINTYAKEDNSVALVYIRPIIMTYNRYELTAISGWDGSRLYTDPDNNSYLYAPQVGAGRKNKDGTFTGMIMGRKGSRLDSDEAVGLFGYSGGRQSIFLDANTGAATFGVNKEIFLNPNPEEYSTIAQWNIGIDKLDKSGSYQKTDKDGINHEIGYDVGLYTPAQFHNKNNNTYTPVYGFNGESIAFQARSGDSYAIITYEGHFYTNSAKIEGGTISGSTIAEDIKVKNLKDSNVTNCTITGGALNKIGAKDKHSIIEKSLINNLRTTNKDKEKGFELTTEGLRQYAVQKVANKDEVTYKYNDSGWFLESSGEATFNDIFCQQKFIFGNASPGTGKSILNVWKRFYDEEKEAIVEDFVINFATVGGWDINHNVISFEKNKFRAKTDIANSSKTTFDGTENVFYLTELEEVIQNNKKVIVEKTPHFSLTMNGTLSCKSLIVNGSSGVSGTFTTKNDKTVTVVNGIITSIV